MVDARGPEDRTGADPAARPAPGAAVPVALALAGIFAIVAIILGVLLWRDDDQAIDDAPQQTTVADIAQDPQSYVGERVTVSGEVSEILTPFAYVLGGEQFVGGDELLVVGPPPAVTTGEAGDEATTEVYAQDIVQISGEVREFNRAELEEEWNAEFPPEAFEGREGSVVLVGEAVSLTQRVRQPEADMVDAGEILDDPDSYYGEQTSVSDEVATVYSERVFSVGDGLIVIDETGVLAETALEEGVNVEVGGEIVQFDQADVGGEDLGDLEGNPVMRAEFIQILDADS